MERESWNCKERDNHTENETEREKERETEKFPVSEKIKVQTT